MEGRIDILTSTLGKALGGGSGGFVAASAEVVGLLRQRSRPYLFSNTLPPAIVGAGIAAFDLLEKADDLRARLAKNTRQFRSRMTAAGLKSNPRRLWKQFKRYSSRPVSTTKLLKRSFGHSHATAEQKKAVAESRR